MSMTEKSLSNIPMNNEVLVLNDQGGSQMNISHDVTATLRAQDHGHPPLVLCEAYRHHGYRESDTFGTLTAEQNQHIRGDTPLIVEVVNGRSEGNRESS